MSARPYSTLASASIVRKGRDNAWSPPMTSLQRERAAAPFADAKHHAGSTLPRLMLVIGFLTLAWMIGRFL